MAISWDDFDKIWASTSPLTPYNFSEVNYKQGWNFVGATPPARQMWDSIQKANDEKFKFLRDNFGTPNMVTTAAQMTDTDKIYVYVGSEAGWNNGHWYYYDAGTSAWVDGGVYNSTAFVTDTTLTEAGKAADAKAVGDSLALKADLAGATFTGNVVVNADFSTTGNTTFDADTETKGNATVDGNSTVKGDSDVQGNGHIGKDLTVDGTSDLKGDVTMEGNATVDKNLTVNGDADTKGNGRIGKDLTVDGTSDLKGDVTTGANVTVGKDLTVNGNAETKGNSVVDGTSDLKGDVTMEGNASVAKDFSVSGNTSLKDTKVDGTLETTGNATIANDLTVSGETTLSGDVTANGNLSVVGNATLSGVSTAVTPAEADNSTNIATTAYVQTEIKPIEADVSVNDKRISNIEKLLQGNLYDYQTDDTSAYTKTVPAGAMPYAGIEQIGGKTLVWNQLVDSGTTTVSTISGHKYYTLIDGTASIVTADGTAITIVNDTADMVTDLTFCYGSGNEPTTVAEFTAQFPAQYYAFTQGTLLSAGVTSVVSVGKNKSLISGSVPMNNKVDIANFGENISLPYITVSFQCTNVTFTNDTAAAFDFCTDTDNYVLVTAIHKADGTKFVKNMSPYTGRAYITLTNRVVRSIRFFTYTTGYANWSGAFSDVQVEFSSAMTEYSAPFTISYPIPASIQSLEGYGWSAGNAYNYIDYERKVFVQNVGSRAYASGDESNTAVTTDMTTTYYPLAEPVETDISAYLTDDNLIEVEAGGTLTFPNSNGDNYKIPVPSTEEYMINLQEAVSNG